MSRAFGDHWLHQLHPGDGWERSPCECHSLVFLDTIFATGGHQVRPHLVLMCKHTRVPVHLSSAQRGGERSLNLRRGLGGNREGATGLEQDKGGWGWVPLPKCWFQGTFVLHTQAGQGTGILQKVREGEPLRWTPGVREKPFHQLCPK